jgi:hypothetical protein
MITIHDTGTIHLSVDGEDSPPADLTPYVRALLASVEAKNELDRIIATEAKVTGVAADTTVVAQDSDGEVDFGHIDMGGKWSATYGNTDLTEQQLGAMIVASIKAAIVMSVTK